MTTMRAIALMGATGTGKSALAMQLAKAHGCAIVCCDSMQVYRGLDIGTAKPTPAEQQQVVHRLVDCVDLPDIFSAQDWAEQAREAILQENQAGRVPLIVGGTGLYLKALLEGFAEIPEEKPEVRLALEAMQHEHGTPWLHQRLQVCDAALAARLPEHDTQRIMRGLAVFESTGTPLSVWQQQEPKVPPVDCPVHVLEIERSVLRQRLAERFDTMMQAGWLEEVRWLQTQHLPATHPVMRAVGYRQLLQYLDGEMPLDQAVTDGITATRRYAKRQQTWFHHQNPDACFADAATLMPRMNRQLTCQN